jgi:hypothetical protein
VAGEGLLTAAMALVADAAGRDAWLAGLRIAGIGWATVELERAAEDLASAFRRAGMPEPRWSPGTRDELLGAEAWVSREPWPAAGIEPAPAVVLLEPDTEGRLAATLARFDEGVGAVYLARRPDATTPIDPTRLGRPATGPLGAARLVLARPAWGPNVLVVDR